MPSCMSGIPPCRQYQARQPCRPAIKRAWRNFAARKQRCYAVDVALRHAGGKAQEQRFFALRMHEDELVPRTGNRGAHVMRDAREIGPRCRPSLLAEMPAFSDGYG